MAGWVDGWVDGCGGQLIITAEESLASPEFLLYPLEDRLL